MGKNKIIAKFILASIVALFISIPMASAEISNCESLNEPENTKGFIITVLEETIGAEEPLIEGSVGIFNCMRVTETIPDATGKEAKTSKYASLGSCPSGGICQRVQVIVAESGISLLFGYLGLIYRWSAGVIGIVSVAYITWGGIQISISGGDSSAIEEGKRKILQSLAGLALLFMSAIILYTINPNFFTL